ncbi:ATPase [Methanosphaera sp. WGK6]|nr:ATPase [Methanosphaera sp. WGK6]
MLKRKQYTEKLEQLIDTETIKVLTGVRRCGKTYILKSIEKTLKEKQIPPKNIIYISFESFEYNSIKNYIDLGNHIKKITEEIEGKIYFLFDEIQNINQWEKIINALRVDYHCDIYITGSNSNMLSGELATLLAGRYIQYQIYPFSYNEILEYHKEILHEEITPTKEIEIFNKYMEYGGFPEILKYPEELKQKYLDSLYNTIILKDIVKRNEIRDYDFLERLLSYIINNIGGLFSARKISKYFKHENRKISLDKILRYISYIIDANIIMKSKRENMKGKQILTINEKYYLVDVGLYNNLIPKQYRNIGSILENIIYVELIRRGYKITIGKQDNLEVDFICRNLEKTIYIQVSWSIVDQTTQEREIKPLLNIKDNNPKYILSMDTFNFSRDNITHINVIDFLKNETI